jgi:hypothetical protein
MAFGRTPEDERLKAEHLQAEQEAEEIDLLQRRTKDRSVVVEHRRPRTSRPPGLKPNPSSATTTIQVTQKIRREKSLLGTVENRLPPRIVLPPVKPLPGKV